MVIAVVGADSVGGLHSTLEQVWQGEGAPTPMIRTVDGNAHMHRALAAIVLDVLDELGI